MHSKQFESNKEYKRIKELRQKEPDFSHSILTKIRFVFINPNGKEQFQEVEVHAQHIADNNTIQYLLDKVEENTCTTLKHDFQL